MMMYKFLNPITDKCIVLDMDETLVHSCVEKKVDPMDALYNLKIYTDPGLLDIRSRCYKINMEDVWSKRGSGEKIEMWGIMRPHLKEFLHFCFNYFRIVIIWSAGQKNYVHPIVNHLFLDLKPPHVIYTFDDLEKLNDGTYIKPLDKLITKYPGLNKYMNLSNTFIVDDRETVYESCNPGNGILIPGYKPSFTVSDLRGKDDNLLKLMSWLQKKEVVDSTDVRTLDKTKIFD